MFDVNQIKPHMPVVCSENGQFAVVDHLEGSNTIKLTRDVEGKHHFIPTSWVTSVDDKVHIDRPGRLAMKEWTTERQSQASTPSQSVGPNEYGRASGQAGGPPSGAPSSGKSGS